MSITIWIFIPESLINAGENHLCCIFLSLYQFLGYLFKNHSPENLLIYDCTFVKDYIYIYINAAIQRKYHLQQLWRVDLMVNALSRKRHEPLYESGLLYI